MIGKTVIKLLWIFPELDRLQLVKTSQYLLADLSTREKKFNPENVLIKGHS